MVKLEKQPCVRTNALQCPGQTLIPELGMKVICREPNEKAEGMRVHLYGTPILRSRREGDSITLKGGTKTLKKLFIDKKIPAADRNRIPVIADDLGVAAVMGIGVDRDHMDAPNWEILFETL